MKMLTNHFSEEEFECKCGCGTMDVDRKFIVKLEMARQLADIPFVINSGCRCIKHNREVGGVIDSAHLTPTKAADILVKNSWERWTILKSLMRVGFNRLGIGRNFIHVDSDETKSPNVIWIYGNERSFR